MGRGVLPGRRRRAADRLLVGAHRGADHRSRHRHGDLPVLHPRRAAPPAASPSPPSSRTAARWRRTSSDEEAHQRPGRRGRRVAPRLRGRPPRPGAGEPRPDVHRARRRAGEGQGGDPLRRWLRPRADARRVRGPGHARRGMPGGGLHLPHPGPDVRGHQGGRRRRRRAPHREELHRRRPQLRDGGRPGPGGRHRGGGGDHQRRRRRAGQPVHGRPPRRGRHGARREDRRAPRPRRARTSRRSPSCAGGSTPRAAAWAWR